MKKIKSVLTAIAVSSAMIAGTASEAFASLIYNDAPVQDNSYVCIVELSGTPLAEYDYAKQNGTDDFIFTEEGRRAYETLMDEHTAAYQTLRFNLDKEIYKLYDYTAVYNGFSVVLTESEYRQIYLDPETYGIQNIYITADLVSDTSDIELKNKTNSESDMTYSDFTDYILEQTGVSSVENRGNSTVIAVIDNEFDLSHEFLTSLPENVTGRITPEFVDDVSPFLAATREKNNDYYLNEKIPYRFNYSTHDTDTSIDYESKEAHGTHVAGIAAGNGYAETNELYDAKGVAPEAQLVLMSSDLTEHAVLAAYDDCAYLGTDVINASFGAACSSIDTTPYSTRAINNLTETGIMFCASAGNDGKINFTGIDSLRNTDYSTGGTPDGVSSVLSVGSAGNPVTDSSIITVGEHNYKLSPGTLDITEEFDGKTKEFEIVPGIGYPEDFEGIDVKGKIAVIERGELTFEEKAQNAADNGAIGVIFYNNVAGEILTPQCSVLPAGMISNVDGKLMIESDVRTVSFESDTQITASPYTTMSDFSAWSYTEDLALKPDITAFGGGIISSLPGNKYNAMSGTSMASPQMTGISALLKEYLKANADKYGIKSESDYPDIMANLLMSTATPVYSSDGMEIASPRVQGSGLVNVENAMNTPVYLYTESEIDNYRPKLSLGDELEKKIVDVEFSFSTFCFHIKNISDTAQTYTLSSDVFRDSVEEEGLAWNVEKADASVKFMYGTEITEITVEPGEDVVINLDLQISVDELNYIKENFGNGTFIDGYIHLNSDSAPDLVLPFMGYYGSWDDSDIFEPFIYNTKKTPSLTSSMMGDSNNNIAGVNSIAVMFNEAITETIPCYSPNGDNVLDEMMLYLGFKRKCSNVEASIYKSSTGNRVYKEQIPLESGSAGVSDEEDTYVTTQYKINWDFADVADGEIYELKLTAESPLFEDGDKREILTQEFKIDTTAPEVTDIKRLYVDGEEYLQIRITDNNGVQGAVLAEESVAGQPEYIDADYADTSSTKDCFVTLAFPEGSDDCYAEIYDMAGNSVTVTPDDADDDYTITFDENMYFSTNDSTFKKKISFTDSQGNDVKYSVSTTPAKAYEQGLTEASILIEAREIMSFPFSVGLAGDTNINGVTDLYDVIKVAKYILWKVNPNGTFSSEFEGFEDSIEEYLSDYDANGTIDLYDAIGIAQKIISAS